MNIIETTDLTPAQKLALYVLWNNEYPEEISYATIAGFDTYLNNLIHKQHLLLELPDGTVVGWAFSFVREGTVWFGIILDSAMHGRGHGSMLLQQLKNRNNILNGWVVDHNNSIRQNGMPYRSPLAFYLKNGFAIRPGTRLETDRISAVKIEWGRANQGDINNQKQYWDSVADKKTFTHPIDIAWLSKYVGKDASILDYGCGYGRVVSILCEHGFSNVVGFDTSRMLIERGLRQTGLNLVHINTPAALPVADNSVDCIILFAVLTCIPANEGQTELLALLHSKLKPDGIIYISDYYLQPDLSEVTRYSSFNSDPANYGVFTLAEGATFRHHTREWIVELLHNFHIKQERTVGVTTMNGHKAQAFQLIARK